MLRGGINISYVASKRGNCFCRPDCRYVKAIKPQNLIRFNSKAEAVQKGYRACQVCGRRT
ncbi:MAG TPA: hypothetical protein GXZ96_00025 [Firmicutes bacterium]|nr:hypothetical protein [Bacillota bacterium]